MNPLDPKKQARILAAWESGEASRREIAVAFGVSPSTVMGLVRAAWQDGRTKRDPNPPSTRASTTGRI